LGTARAAQRGVCLLRSQVDPHGSDQLDDPHVVERGTWLASAGALAQVVGFGVDAWLHGRDPGLAARERVFSLDNAGHMLVAGGLLLVVVGLGLMWAGLRAVPVVSVLVVAVGVAAALAPATPHQHPRDEDARVAQARARAAEVIPGLLHAHGDPPDPSPMDAATRRILAAQLVQARAVALR
jgi:hypothetical protein